MRLLVPALASLALLSACSIGDRDEPGIAGTGSGDTRSYAATGFDEVEAAGPDNVEVRVGPNYSVRAQGSAAALERLRIRVEDSKLTVARRSGDDNDGGAARIVVTLPRLTGASVAGSGDLRVDKVEAAEFEGAIAGSGNLTLGAVQLEELELNIAGSGTIRAGGRARRLEVNIAGSGRIDAPGLTAQGGEVSIAGSGDVRANVDGAAKVEVMGAGNVDLGPRARCEVTRMGAGSVRCAQ